MHADVLAVRCYVVCFMHDLICGTRLCVLYSLLSLSGIAGGVWGGEYEMRAIAVKYNRDIVVIAPRYVLLYRRDTEFVAPGKPKGSLSSPYLKFGSGGNQYLTGDGTRAKFDLPASAFNPETLIVMYDGSTHFWTVYKRHAVFGGEAVDMAQTVASHNLRLWKAPACQATADVACAQANAKHDASATKVTTAASSLLMLGQQGKARPVRKLVHPGKWKDFE